MRGLISLLAIVGICGFPAGASAEAKLRLAQSSITTTCMLSCNSTYVTCQSACIVPGTPPTGAATTTSNASASSSCLLGCTTQQQACQTTCARISPSQ
jgi:hypothetical protein